MRAVVCMSSLVPQNKVQAIRALGAEVHIVGSSQDDAQEKVQEFVDKDGLVMLAPFDHPDVIAGPGTLGLEIPEQAPAVRSEGRSLGKGLVSKCRRRGLPNEK